MKKILTYLLVLLMCAGAPVFAAELKFVQLSDTHYLQNGRNTSFKLIGESPRLLDEAIEQINAIDRLSFVMFTGDMIDLPRKNELLGFLSYAQKINAPHYYAIGNHDIGKTLSREEFVQLAGMPSDYYSFSPQKGFKVIVLDAVTPYDNGQVVGKLNKEQLAWLDEQIACAGRDVILIFMHHPVVEPFASADHKLLNADELDRVLSKYKNPVAVFSGHYHAAKITQKENVLYVSSPSLVTYPNAFRVVNVKTGFKNVTFDICIQETGLKNLQKTAKLFLLGSSVNLGEEKDLNGVYKIAR